MAAYYGDGLIRIRLEGVAIIVAPGEVRHLVDVLGDAATRVVDRTAQAG
jgi:hypothetical protein